MSIDYGFDLLGGVALSQGDYTRAGEMWAASLALARKKQRKDRVAVSLCHLGALALAQGDVEQAAQKYSESMALSLVNGYIVTEAIALCGLGKAEYARGDLASARAHFHEAIKKWPGTAYITGKTECILEALTFLATVVFTDPVACPVGMHLAVAARLLGATEAWHAKFQFTRSPRDRQEREACRAAVRAVLGEEAFAAAWAEGLAMPIERAVVYAREHLLA
jgi:tetratricopeptide (TPR) repeat protein